MHLRQCWLLQAACSLMVIAAAVTTAYATPASTEDHQKLKQAEVLASQQPLRRGSLKYGDTFTTDKASLPNVELLPTSSTPVRQKGASSRQGKRFEDIAGNGVLLSTIATERHNRSAERQPQNRNQTNRSKEVVSSGERQAVRSPQANRSKEATSGERQPARSVSNRSKEATSAERQPNRGSALNRSKEEVSGERHSVGTISNRSKEATSGERQATRGHAINTVEEGTPSNHSKELNSSPSTPTLITNNENLPKDQDPKHIQSTEGIGQLLPRDASLNTSNTVNSPPPVAPLNTPQILEDSEQLLPNNNPETANAPKDIPHEVQHTVQHTNEHTALLANPSDSRLARRHNAQVASQNQLVVQQYEIPIVQKTHKPITPTVGQQQQQPQQQLPTPNQSRFSIEQPATRPQRQHHSARADAVVQPNAHRQSQLSPTRNGSQRYSQDSTLPLSRNSNHNKINGRRNSAEIVGVSHSSNGNRRSPLNGNSNAGGSQQQRSGSSATNVANGPQSQPPPPHIRKPSPSTTAIATTTSRPFFTLPNQYNIFSSEFWQFLNPATRANHQPTTTKPATTKRPPKKYIPPTLPQHQVSPKEEKVNYPTKPIKTVYQPKDTTTPQPEPIKTNNLQQPVKKDDGPFRIALPTFNFLTPRKESTTATGDSDKEKRDTDDENVDLRAKFNCPRESEVRFQLFPKICKIDEDCKTWNRGEICCDIFGAKSCVTGIPKPLEETSHSPILGLIPRKCPDRPLAELWWEVQECETDMDCWPRVCCPDGRRRYCRTSQPELNTIPVPVKRSFNYLTEYLECTAPPPRIFDLHPKACTSTLDCFPNVCCQEAGLRHCRPPKKSVLTMLATVFNVDLVKRLTQNIVIK